MVQWIRRLAHQPTAEATALAGAPYTRQTAGKLPEHVPADLSWTTTHHHLLPTLTAHYRRLLDATRSPQRPSLQLASYFFFHIQEGKVKLWDCWHISDVPLRHVQLLEVLVPQAPVYTRWHSRIRHSRSFR